MLLILRFIFTIVFALVICITGIIYCVITPWSMNHVYRVARFFRFLAPVYGVKVINRYEDETSVPEQAIYIANHQNNYDLITAASMVQPRTVTVGKKSLVWIPIWGQLYWISGNILIDRNNRQKSHQTITQIVDRMKQKMLSVWMFPEGTRSRGRGLMPFKAGAFHAAIAAGLPIVPICVSNTCSGKINLNRLNNGYVIVEMLKPIDTTAYQVMENQKEAAKLLSKHCYDIVQSTLERLDSEVKDLEKAH